MKTPTLLVYIFAKVLAMCISFQCDMLALPHAKNKSSFV